MKTLKLSFLVLILSLGTSIMSQTIATKPAPKWIVEKCELMKVGAETDLNLTKDEATKFFDIMVEIKSTVAEKIKDISDDEGRKEVYKAVNKSLREKVKTTFPKELADKILVWYYENNSKFNK